MNNPICDQKIKYAEVQPRKPPTNIGNGDSLHDGPTNTASTSHPHPNMLPSAFERGQISTKVKLVSAPMVGRGEHRSGWPHALRSLVPIVSQNGVLLDDFVERSFAYGKPMAAHTRPWVGIFHHPPNMPSFYFAGHRPQELFRSQWWLHNSPSLRLAIALTDYLAEYLRETLSVPVAVVRHPTVIPNLRFSAEAFRKNPCKRLVQIGWYLRNTRCIHQLPELPGFVRTRLMTRGRTITYYDAQMAQYWRTSSSRREYEGVETIPRVSDTEYDLLLSRNVAFAEYFDASASNLVVECLARNTPIVTNRHPALVEYLGAEYPLFFDRLEDVPNLLSESTVLRAHECLAARDKSFLDGGVFCRQIASEISRIAA